MVLALGIEPSYDDTNQVPAYPISQASINYWKDRWDSNPHIPVLQTVLSPF